MLMGRGRAVTTLVLLGLGILTSGFSSCAGAAGPLLAPMQITPDVVLLRSSLTRRETAIGLARVDGGASRNRYRSSIEYGKDPGPGWLTVEIQGNVVTLTADPGGLDPGVRLATVTIDDVRSGNSGTVAVEFTVVP